MCYSLASQKVFTIFRSTLIKLPPKVLKYRSYKNFDENKFCRDLDQILIKGDVNKAKDPYTKLTNILYNTLEKHAPLKSKTVRGNQAPFMNKELSKTVIEKSRNLDLGILNILLEKTF